MAKKCVAKAKYLAVMNPHMPISGELAGESDREIRNIRILLGVTMAMGIIAIAVPSIFSHLGSIISFLPQMMIGLAVLVLVIYLHFALQRKLLRELRTAWAAARKRGKPICGSAAGDRRPAGAVRAQPPLR